MNHRPLPVSRRLRPLAVALLAIATAAQATTLATHSYSYDTLGRLVTDTDANSHVTTYTYDNNGNRLTATDALGRVTTYTYDELNRLATVTDANSHVTTLSYDALGHTVSVTDPAGHSTTYTYNGLDQLLTQVSPDTGTTTYGYDAAGNATTRKNASNYQATRTYDALNRLTKITYASGTVVNYTWDQGTNGVGRLSQISASPAKLAWTWDSFGRPLSKTETINASSLSYTVGYQYDADSNSTGHLSSVTYPTGDVLSYSYDSQGRIQSLSFNGNTVLGTVTYSPFIGISGWTWANGTSHSRSYDQNANLTSISIGSGGITLGYDAALRINSIQDITTLATQTFGYDNLDRLSSYSGAYGSRAWTYDNNGNRLSQSVASATDSYTISSTSNRLSSYTPSGGSAKTQSYNSIGQITGDGTNTYTYDLSARERLTGVSNSAGSASYTLDPLGERVAKIVTSGGSTTTTNFVYDEAGHLLAETDNTGAIVKEYLWMGDTPVGLVAPGTGTGTPIVVDNSATEGSFKINGPYTVNTGSGGYYGADYYTRPADTGTPAGIIIDDRANTSPNGANYTQTWAVVGAYPTGYADYIHFTTPDVGAPTGTIYDDSTASFTGSGWYLYNCSWVACTPSAAGGQTTSHLSPAGTGGNTATWTVNIPSSGTYAVYAMWDSTSLSTGTNRATNAPYTITTASGAVTVTANQQTNTGRWQLLGTYSFNAGSTTVSLSNNANGIVSADGILIAVPGGTTSYLANYNWTTTLASSGSYNIYARWSPTATANATGVSWATNAPYTINTSSGPQTVSADQTQNLSHWNLLGTYTLPAGAQTPVSLGANANGSVIADAVLLSPAGTGTLIYDQASWTPSLPGVGQYTVYARWVANSSNVTAAPYTITTSTGPQTVSEDQTQNGGQWVSLGTYTLNPATATVSLSMQGSSGQTVSIDAVEFVPTGLIPGSSVVYNVHADQLGTPRQITTSDTSNTLLWRWDSEPFGAIAPNSNPSGVGTFTFNLRFPGQYYDAESGLSYNANRDYNPGTGRYIQSDPIGLWGGQFSTYAYVKGNPIRWVDPLGLETKLITTNDDGFGSHSGLYINTPGQDPFLYDPGGSYKNDTRGSGGFFSGDDANLQNYLNWEGQHSDGVSTTDIPLTPQQEQQLINNITADNHSDPGPGYCANSVSSELAAVGACGGKISPTWFPGNLKSEAEKCPAAPKKKFGQK